jgi:hypothetical protein
MADSTQALTQLIKILEPLSSEDRHRTINAALTFLGDHGLAPAAAKPIAQQQRPGSSHTPGGDGGHSSDCAARMKKHGIPVEHVDAVYHFRNDGTFDIIKVPGKNKRERMLAAYAIVGLGTYLATDKRDFADTVARKVCEDQNCYDPANHAASLREDHPAFVGDKIKGWSLTTPGIRIAAGLLNEVAEAAE